MIRRDHDSAAENRGDMPKECYATRMKRRSVAGATWIVAAALTSTMTVFSEGSPRAPVLAPQFSPAPALQPSSPPATVIDLTAVDARSRPVTDLRPDELAVTLDGIPREILGLRYLPRAVPPSSRDRIEPAPVVVMVVDERTIGRETERGVRASAARLLDQLFHRLGPSARVAVVRWPGKRSVELTSVRRSLQKEIGRLRGRAEEPSALLPPEVGPQICTGPECDRALKEAGSDAPRDALLAAQAVAVRSTLWEHGRTSLSGLAGLVRALQGLPGCKTVLVLAPGLLVDNGEPDLDRLAEAAALSRVSIYGLELPAPHWLRSFYNATFVDRWIETAPGNPVPAAASGSVAYGREGLAMMAERGGGAVCSLAGSDDSLPGEALAEELAGLYAVEIEGAESDRDGKAHRVSVTTRRADVRLRMRARWAAREDARDLPAVAARKPEPGVASSTPGLSALSPGDVFPERVGGAALVRHTCPVPAAEMSLPQLLACAADAIVDFEREFPSVVAEERLEQMARVRDSAGFIYTKRRTTRADMLLIEDPTGGWMPFRDVLEVDGTPLRDRGDRLRKLFLEQPGTAVEQARAIAEESARFNLGTIRRTINVPTLPLLFLEQSHAPRFSFKAGGEAFLGGVLARIVEFSEQARPTFISGSRGANVPVSGTFWIDPRSGCVMASRIDVGEADVQMKALVTYAPEPVSGLWVPVEMREQYRRNVDGGDFVNTRASYSRFRRFQVTTSEAVKDAGVAR